jgi:hypothetical protein
MSPSPGQSGDESVLDRGVTPRGTSPMTIYSARRVTCSVCGTAAEQRVLMSTNASGSPDLDMRPPGMERSTLQSWLQECPNCGFVSGDVGEDEEGTRAIVASEGFKQLGDAAPSSRFVGRCLKRSFIDERLGRTAEAALHLLWAAWAADDANAQAAVEYRSRAADLFLAAAAVWPTGSIESVTIRTRTIDILRRAERWEEAASLADALLVTRDLDPTIRSVVAFERQLIQARDHAAYTLKEALSA